jgi:hypothetical protein
MAGSGAGVDFVIYHIPYYLDRDYQPTPSLILPHKINRKPAKRLPNVRPTGQSPHCNHNAGKLSPLLQQTAINVCDCRGKCNCTLIAATNKNTPMFTGAFFLSEKMFIHLWKNFNRALHAGRTLCIENTA